MVWFKTVSKQAEPAGGKQTIVSQILTGLAHALVFLGAASLFCLTEAAAASAHVDHTMPPAERISAYHLFKDAARQIPNDRVVPYDLNTPHFADYATLHRFVWMPEGKSCTYAESGDIEFPVGAVIIITIGYAADLREPDSAEHIVETRLWIRRQKRWTGAQYVWNKETTEANLSVVGGRTEVSWLHTDGTERSHVFGAPNRNQCLQCHEIDNKLVPLGPVHAKYLNKDFHYANGTENQLTHWANVGYLKHVPEKAELIPQVPVWNDPSTGDLESRARAYLDMNCSSCHRKGGIAITSGLDLTYQQSVPVKFGIFKSPVAAGRAAGNGRFVIEPGYPERSILLMRLKSTDPGIRMPIVGRGLMHEEGVALISEWIAAMKYPERAAAQNKIDQRAIQVNQILAARAAEARQKSKQGGGE